jgi:hypothetical protein
MGQPVQGWGRWWPLDLPGPAAIPLRTGDNEENRDFSPT